MSNLAREYFQRELTEAEEDNLAAEMASSSEASQAFIEAARLSYEATGLPDPSLPDASGGGASFKGLVIMLVVLFSVVGFMGWALYRVATAPPLETAVAASVETTSNGQVQTNSFQEQSVSMLSAVPTVVPPKRERYEALGVVVRMSSPGAVAVRVLDPRGIEVRRLFHGILPAGEKEFIWDRRSQDGTDAKPGLYRIEVFRGGKSFMKEVKLDY